MSFQPTDPLPDCMRILIVVAHPDDADFGAAGTVAIWAAEGHHVHYCICTNGDAGGFDPEVARHEIPLIRQDEQRAAARALGADPDNITFLGYPDGQLTSSLELRRDITRVIRKVRPHRVVTQSPERNYDFIYASHPDHMAAGEATLCAVYPDARNPFAYAELGLQDWAVSETWLMSYDQPNHAVDISDTFDAKVRALLAHESQTGHIGEAKLREMLGTMAAIASERCNDCTSTLVEPFRVINTR